MVYGIVLPTINPNPSMWGTIHLLIQVAFGLSNRLINDEFKSKRGISGRFRKNGANIVFLKKMAVRSVVLVRLPGTCDVLWC